MKQKIFLQDYPKWMTPKQRNFFAWALIIIILSTPLIYGMTIGKQKPTVQLFDSFDLKIKNEILQYTINKRQIIIDEQQIIIDEQQISIINLTNENNKNKYQISKLNQTNYNQENIIIFLLKRCSIK